MRNKEKCLHSLDYQDIKSGRSSIKLIIAGIFLRDNIEHIIEHHYCPICSCHWQNGIKYEAAEWAAKKINPGRNAE